MLHFLRLVSGPPIQVVVWWHWRSRLAGQRIAPCASTWCRCGRVVLEPEEALWPADVAAMLRGVLDLTMYRILRGGRSAKLMCVAVAVALVLTFVPGCEKVPLGPVTEKVLDPKIVKSFPVDYWVSSTPNKAISPDGKYAQIVKWGTEANAVVALPLAADGAESGAGDIELFKAKRTDDYGEYVELIGVGWISDTACVFIVSGVQPQGPHEGARGVAAYTADIVTGQAEEIDFIPLEKDRGTLNGAELVAESGKMLIHISKEIWAVDLQTKSTHLVKGELPTYDGLFTPRLSPDGTAYAYRILDDDRRGVYRLDVESGEEKLLAGEGETASFGPIWSPDGKYIAVYTVPKVDDTNDPWRNYDYYLGEDGPLTIASAVTVLNSDGGVVRTVSLEDKILTNVIWSPDSTRIAFVAGPKRSTNQYDEDGNWAQTSFIWDGIWSADATAQTEPVRLWDMNPPVDSNQSWATPVSFDPLGKGVFVQISASDDESTAVWYVGMGKAALQMAEDQPVRVLDGHWEYYPCLPMFGDSLVVLMDGDPGTMWMMNSDRVAKVDEFPQANTEVIAYDGDTLVTFEARYRQSNTITVRSMFTEKAVQQGK